MPQLEGKVIDVGQIQVVAKRKPGVIRGFVTTLLFFIRPMIVVGAWILGGRRPTEYRSVHMIRVRQRDGTIRQARIEHDMLGATMDPGDDVSIWGRARHGVIVVQYAYNHTVGAEVCLTGGGNPIKSWLLIFVGVILFLFFLGSREW